MSRAEPARTRTFSWDDPLASAAKGVTMDGLDYLRLVASGELPPPPIASLLGMTIDELEHGRAVFGLEQGPDYGSWTPTGDFAAPDSSRTSRRPRSPPLQRAPPPPRPRPWRPRSRTDATRRARSAYVTSS